MKALQGHGGFVFSRGYDFTFILGGALLTLALPFVVTLLPAALPAIFWGWIIFFEGSHFWATLSRTYFDRKFSTEHRGVLVRSLVFFLIPALAVAHWKLTGSKLAIDLYGFAIFVWSLYHNTRQHYGFLSIYAKREDATAERKAKRTTLLYFAICVPQLYFLMFHKGPLALSFFPKPADLGSLAPILRAACWTLSAATGVALLAQLLRPGEGKRPMTVVYSTVCWVFYCTMFYAVAPREPFLVGAQNGAQLLMLLAVMNSLFHNIQYHAIVWIYARRRYAENVTPDARSGFGWAARINGSLFSYAAVATAMGCVFGIVSGLGDWPSITGAYAPSGMSAVSYVLFFGIVGHHFYLDQHIWRPSRQADLRSYLKLDAGAPAVPA